MQYIQDVLNMQNDGLNEAQHRFIDVTGRLMAAWDLPPASGRVYGYLLLSERPVSLDQIAVDLQMSKSGASVAGKLLETWGLVHRIHERGSRRILYEPTDDFDQFVETRTRASQAFIDVFQQGAAAATSDVAKKRMEDMVALFDFLTVEMEKGFRSWRARRES